MESRPCSRNESASGRHLHGKTAGIEKRLLCRRCGPPEHTIAMREAAEPRDNVEMLEARPIGAFIPRRMAEIATSAPDSRLCRIGEEMVASGSLAI